MVTFPEARPKSSGVGRFILRLSEILAEARVDYARWRLYRQTLKELQALGAHDRNVLGQRKADLRRIARVTVYGPVAGTK